ncbi:MAG: phage DNA packaging protein J [Limnobacter sp.]|nr:phage DNA packaging protein J [Limnobacter sp.]
MDGARPSRPYSSQPARSASGNRVGPQLWCNGCAAHWHGCWHASEYFRSAVFSGWGAAPFLAVPG